MIKNNKKTAIIILTLITCSCSWTTKKNPSFLFYTNPSNYYRFSEKILKQENYKKIWSIKTPALTYGNINFKKITNNNLLATAKNNQYYITDISSLKPVTYHRNYSLNKVFAYKNDIIDLHKNKIVFYSLKDFSLKRKIKFSYESVYSSGRNIDYYGNGYINGYKNHQAYMTKGKYLIFYQVAYEYKAYYSYRRFKYALATKNIVSFRVLDTTNWKLIETDSIDILSHVSNGLFSKMIFSYLQNLTLVEGGNYLVFSLGDGDGHQVSGYFSLKEYNKQKVTLGFAKDLVKRFPKDLFIVEKKKTDKQKAEDSIAKSKRKKENFIIGGKEYKVFSYKMQKDGVLLYLKNLDSSTSSTLIKAKYDMKTIIWKYNFNNYYVKSGVNIGKFIMVPEIINNSGAVISLRSDNGQKSSLVFPTNLMKKNNVLNITDTGFHNNNIILFDIKSGSLNLFKKTKGKQKK